MQNEKSLAKLLAESNCKSLGVNFINTCSENQQAELSDTGPQVSPPLAECILVQRHYIFSARVKTS
jgi:hypothetical protein